MMRLLSTLALFSCVVSYANCVVTFPRQSDSLVIYPMSNSHGFNDVSGKSYHGTNWYSSACYSSGGPFGDGSVLKPCADNYGIFDRRSWSISLSSFTVSFFVKIGTQNTMGGLMSFRSSIDVTKTFAVYYRDNSTMEVWANGIQIGAFTVFHYNVWTFVSLAFNSSTGELSIYNRHGLIYSASYQPDIRSSGSFNNYGVNVGYVESNGLGTRRMYLNDAMACMSVYSVALRETEIRALHDACRAILGSPPCGTPRLAYTSVPSTSTTVPKTGQFPWTASLLSGSTHICSASILDPYWLITAARCFKESTSPLAYKVVAGEYDLAVSETYQRNHTINKITLSPTSASSGLIGELALILLNDPIDLTNTYVNNICPFRDEADLLNLEEKSFMFGWGENGRSPLVSQTLPRYVSGKMLSDTQCNQQLGSKYNSTYHYCFVGSSPDFTVPCNKDEGSPLLAVTNDFSSSKGIGPYLAELAVFVQRDSACAALTPGIFAKVAPYVEWITEKIACVVPSAGHYPTFCPQRASSPCGC